MAEKDMYDMYNRMLGSELEGIEIDSDEEIIYFNTNRGTISIEGQDLHMYVETDRYEH
tara:strand:+ start:19406 stop:19579 length:174 start_codon:yes stop_codon:yes gene_type:complete